MVALLTACGGDDEKTPATRSSSDRVLDVRSGSYEGVSLGARRDGVFAAFGTTASRGPATTLANPEGSDGPPVVQLASGTSGASLGVYRYDHAVAMLADGRLRALLVDDPRAVTPEDVGVGDPLDRVSDEYPGATCGESQEGTEYEPFPACYVELAPDRHAWFGGDPIRSITIADVKIGDL